MPLLRSNQYDVAICPIALRPDFKQRYRKVVCYKLFSCELELVWQIPFDFEEFFLSRDIIMHSTYVHAVVYYVASVLFVQELGVSSFDAFLRFMYSRLCSKLWRVKFDDERCRRAWLSVKTHSNVLICSDYCSLLEKCENRRRSGELLDVPRVERRMSPAVDRDRESSFPGAWWDSSAEKSS